MYHWRLNFNKYAMQLRLYLMWYWFQKKLNTEFVTYVLSTRILAVDYPAEITITLTGIHTQSIEGVFVKHFNELWFRVTVHVLLPRKSDVKSKVQILVRTYVATGYVFYKPKGGKNSRDNMKICHIAFWFNLDICISIFLFKVSV